MKKDQKLKTISLTLGTVAMVMLPVATVIACGTDETEKLGGPVVPDGKLPDKVNKWTTDSVINEKLATITNTDMAISSTNAGYVNQKLDIQKIIGYMDDYKNVPIEDLLTSSAHDPKDGQWTMPTITSANRVLLTSQGGPTTEPEYDYFNSSYDFSFRGTSDVTKEGLFDDTLGAFALSKANISDYGFQDYPISKTEEKRIELVGSDGLLSFGVLQAQQYHSDKLDKQWKTEQISNAEALEYTRRSIAILETVVRYFDKTSVSRIDLSSHSYGSFLLPKWASIFEWMYEVKNNETRVDSLTVGAGRLTMDKEIVDTFYRGEMQVFDLVTGQERKRAPGYIQTLALLEEAAKEAITEVGMENKTWQEVFNKGTSLPKAQAAIGNNDFIKIFTDYKGDYLKNIYMIHGGDDGATGPLFNTERTFASTKLGGDIYSEDAEHSIEFFSNLSAPKNIYNVLEINELNIV